tara:strand:- start:5992 stop:6636 length:645 start_codon:yes stop_codon:yes gene_type:complete
MKLKMKSITTKTKRKRGRPKTVVERTPLKVKRTRKITEEHREALRERMVEMRKNRKPAEYKNIHPSVLAKSENDKLSHKNVKAWIKEAKETASAHAKNARSRTISPQQQAHELALSESKKAYVRQMEHYLKRGDWISDFMGLEENERTQWRCVSMAYYPDGTPKRTVGIWYSDIGMKWEKGMKEESFNKVERKFDPPISITDTIFRKNEHKLAL